MQGNCMNILGRHDIRATVGKDQMVSGYRIGEGFSLFKPHGEGTVKQP